MNSASLGSQKLKLQLQNLVSSFGITPAFKRDSSQSASSKGLATFASMACYMFLSLIPVYGFTSLGSLSTKDCVLECTAIDIARNIAFTPEAYYEAVFVGFGVLDPLVNERERAELMRGMKVMLLAISCGIKWVLVSRLSSVTPLVAVENLEFAKTVAAFTSFLGGLLFFSLQNFVQAFSMPDTTRALWQISDILVALSNNKPSKLTWHCLLSLVRGVAWILLVLFADSLLCVEINYSRGAGLAGRRKLSCIDQIRAAQVNHKLIAGTLSEVLRGNPFSLYHAIVKFCARVWIGRQGDTSTIEMIDSWKVFQSEKYPFFSTPYPYKYNNIPLNWASFQSMGFKATYYLFVLPLYIFGMTHLSGDSYSSKRITLKYLGRGCAVEGHNHYDTANRAVEEKLSRLSFRTLLFLPLEFLLDSYWLVKGIDAGSILSLFSKVNTLYEQIID